MLPRLRHDRVDGPIHQEEHSVSMLPQLSTQGSIEVL